MAFCSFVSCAAWRYEAVDLSRSKTGSISLFFVFRQRKVGFRKMAVCFPNQHDFLDSWEPKKSRFEKACGKQGLETRQGDIVVVSDLWNISDTVFRISVFGSFWASQIFPDNSRSFLSLEGMDLSSGRRGKSQKKSDYAGLPFIWVNGYAPNQITFQTSCGAKKTTGGVIKLLVWRSGSLTSLPECAVISRRIIRHHFIV